MSQPHALEDKPPINWPTTLMFIVTPLAAAVLVPWYGIVHGFSRRLLGGLRLLPGRKRHVGHGGLSPPVGASHVRGAHGACKILYLIFSSMALQNSALVWCSGHRIHHLHVDDNDLDPYSAGRGFWFSHIGWMLRYYPSGTPDFSNARDLERDPLLAFQHRHYLAIAIGVNVGLTIGAGFLVGDVVGTFIRAGILRVVISHHLTFLINSLAHMWGTRPYTEENSARDNPVLAFLTHGEGYHNFHHIFAHDYRNGVRWWQWDPTKWLVASMQFLGMTRRLKRTPAFQIQRALLAMQFQRAQERLANSAPRHEPRAPMWIRCASALRKSTNPS